MKPHRKWLVMFLANVIMGATMGGFTAAAGAPIWGSLAVAWLTYYIGVVQDYIRTNIK